MFLRNSCEEMKKKIGLLKQFLAGQPILQKQKFQNHNVNYEHIRTTALDIKLFITVDKYAHKLRFPKKLRYKSSYIQRLCDTPL